MSERRKGRRRRIKVEAQLYLNGDGHLETRSKIRLQGQWLSQVFEPGSYVDVTPAVRNGRRVLILRET